MRTLTLLLVIAVSLWSCKLDQKDTLSASLTVPFDTEYPIPLEADMIFNISARGDSYRLIDAPNAPIEFGKTLAGGAPWDKNFQENAINRSFLGSFNDYSIYRNSNLYFPIEIIIDLKQPRVVNKLCLTDLNGDDSITLSYLKSSPDNWVEVFTQKLDKTFEWRSFDNLQIKAQYLKLSISSANANIGEIRLFSNTKTTTNKTKFPKREFPTFKYMMGTNINTEDPVHQMGLFEFVREYQDWHVAIADNKPENCKPYRWNPSMGYAGWSFDKLYDDITDVGVNVSANLKGNIPAYEVYSREDKPTAVGNDTYDPSSYAAHAEYLYQYAARYGSTKVATNKIEQRVNETPKTGLNLVHYIENWNEQDKYWMGAEKSPGQEAAYFHPYEYAAMLSADYDGHEGSVKFKPTASACGSNYNTGIKNADPNTKVVLSGIIEFNLDYIKAIQLWARLNRKDGKFPADAINYHHYSNDVGSEYGTAKANSKGISPEADKLYEKLKYLVDYRDQFLPEQEIWFSEFGYDTHPNSPQSVPVISPFDAEEVQAQWLVRAYFAIAAAGIDKAQQFMLTDAYQSDMAQRFSTCGLLELAKKQDYSTPFPEFRAKKAYYYLYAMKNILRDYRFEQIIPTNNPNISVYQFSNENDVSKKVYAVWANTSENYRQQNLSLPIDTKQSQVRLVELKNLDLDGISSQLTVNNGRVTIPEVSERPLFIVTHPERPDFDGCQWNIALSPEMIRLENGSQWGDPKKLIDEPYLENTSNTPRQPICNMGGTPLNAWTGLPGEVFKEEAAAIIDLQKNHLIKGIAIFDGAGQGTIRIERGQPGNWTLIDTYHTRKYNEWKHWLNLDVETQYLRIIAEDHQATIHEIVLLGWEK